MDGLNSVRFGSVRSKCTVMVLVICFSAMVLFGSPLHAHDLESSHVDLDCISCHLVNSKVGLEHEEPDLFVEIQETQSVSISTTPLIIRRTLFVSNRGPPVTCWFLFFKKYINNFFDQKSICIKLATYFMYVCITVLENALNFLIRKHIVLY